MTVSETRMIPHFLYFEPIGYLPDVSDCDDNNNTINPDATEICNNVDDDCQNGIDIGATDMLTFMKISMVMALVVMLKYRMHLNSGVLSFQETVMMSPFIFTDSTRNL